jgi:hypothetical protein
MLFSTPLFSWKFFFYEITYLLNIV